jgi:glycosyltransferase involved in cell wall biosynthesis
MHWLNYIVIIVAVFGGLRLFVALINLISFKRLAEKGESIEVSLAVLIPARNEEANIANILNDLLKQTYSDFEILVYDDLSEDATVAAVSNLQKENSNIKLINGAQLPNNWGGKSHACYQLAKQTDADLILFLDADVRVSKDFIQKIISHSVAYRLDLLSIFPVQLTKSCGEKAVVPLFNWILLTLLPLNLVRKSSWSSFSAANGQCMLFDGDNYRKNQWHKSVKAEVVEDIAIMREMKKHRYNVETLIGQNEISCRMYHSFYESFVGLARSAPAFFANHLGWTTFFLIAVLIGPIVSFYVIGFWYLIVFAAFVIILRLIVSIISKSSIFQMFIWHIPQMVVLPVIVINGFVMRYRKRYKWKNRELNL